MSAAFFVGFRDHYTNNGNNVMATEAIKQKSWPKNFMEKKEVEFSERLEILMKMLNTKSVNAFASSVGISTTIIQNFLGTSASGRKSKPSLDTLGKIKAKYPRVNLEWLITGDGEPLRPLSWESTSPIAQVTGNRNITQAGSGNQLKIDGLDDCTQQLEHWMERAKTYEALANDRQTIIELMRKAANA